MDNKIKLDATMLTESGPELVNAISEKVRRTQLFLVTELPNELLITEEQFKSLMGVENSTSYMSSLDNPFASLGSVKKAYIFYTPLNAMDVVIVDAPELNLPEAGEMKSNDDK